MHLKCSANQNLSEKLLGIAQRTVVAVFDCPSQRFSPRKLIPVNVKTLGDQLHLARIKANLSQPEVAQMAGVSIRTVRKWESGQVCPTEDHWQALAHYIMSTFLILHRLKSNATAACWFLQVLCDAGSTSSNPHVDLNIHKIADEACCPDARLNMF